MTRIQLDAFFANPSLSAEITSIHEDLIKKFSIILRAKNSGCEINLKHTVFTL